MLPEDISNGYLHQDWSSKYLIGYKEQLSCGVTLKMFRLIDYGHFLLFSNGDSQYKLIKCFIHKSLISWNIIFKPVLKKLT